MSKYALLDAEATRDVAFTALEVLRQYQGNEQMTLMLTLLDAMHANYAIRLTECQEREVAELRVAAKQVALLRHALTEKDPQRIEPLI